MTCSEVKSASPCSHLQAGAMRGPGKRVLSRGLTRYGIYPDGIGWLISNRNPQENEMREGR